MKNKYHLATNFNIKKEINMKTSVEWLREYADVNVDVKVDWLSNVIDCPITDLSSTLKYILGAIILGSGTYLVYRNVKKSKNNI